MCGGRMGAARSCARVFAYVVGSRIAGLVCACGGAACGQKRAAWPRTRPRAAEQAAAQRYLMRTRIKYMNLIFSSCNYMHSRDCSRLRHGNRHMIMCRTRQQKLKLRAASGIAPHTIACISSTDEMHERTQLSAAIPAHSALCGSGAALDSCLAPFKRRMTAGDPRRRGRRTRSAPIVVAPGTMAELEIPRGKAVFRAVAAREARSA